MLCGLYLDFENAVAVSRYSSQHSALQGGILGPQKYLIRGNVTAPAVNHWVAETEMALELNNMRHCYNFVPC